MPRIHPVLLALALLCAGVAPAAAEDTILRLSESATVMVAPDQLEASLRAEAVAVTAQEAQRRVNELMRDALVVVRKGEGIAAATGVYNAWRVPPASGDRGERWQAGQTLALTSKDGDALLRLIGELQQKGMVQAGLAWRLSGEAERRARREATKQALSGLRGRADEAAALLGLRFEMFREVRLDSVIPPMMPRRVTAPRNAASPTGTPPAAEAEDLAVTASAEADIILKAR